MKCIQKVEELIARGVEITNPYSIEIGKEVDISKISSNGVKIYSGCKIFGEETLISNGVLLGLESPVTLNNCKIARNVELKGGYFENSIFMEDVISASGSHIRANSILEEHTSIAHSVGLKQTILFPFVKVGSLVNFCDCFMSGGSSNVNHSEVGSSYVHFNYTVNQDKATPSLIGNVPYGVMLNQNPIFLGGQGGLIGPCRIAHGTIIGAGVIQRKDQITLNKLIFPNFTRGGSIKHIPGFYRSVSRQAFNNILYIANLLSLMGWYRNIRSFFVEDSFSLFFFKSLLKTLERVIKNRIYTFKIFCEKLQKSSILCSELLKVEDNSLLIKQKKELYNNRNNISDIFHKFLMEITNGAKVNSEFLSLFSKNLEKNGFSYNYIKTIKRLNPELIIFGTSWLQGIVDEVINEILNLLPSIK